MKHPEMGRELLADELQVRTVVILSREDSAFAAYTVGVFTVGDELVSFRAGEIATTLIVRRHLDGTLTDETGQRIHVWEYLGEV